MDFITLDIKSVEQFVISKLAEVGEVVTQRIGANYPGLPFSVAETWGRLLKIHVCHFEYMQDMALCMDQEFRTRHPYGVYLVQGPKQKIGHYYFRHPMLMSADP